MSPTGAAIGIEEVAGYLPVGRIDCRELAARFGVPAQFVEAKTGFLRLAVRGEGEETSQLCTAAFAALSKRVAVDPASVDCLITCTQNPDGRGIPHTSAAVHAALGLPRTCATFDLSLGCSGYVYGLSIAKAFMEANGLRRGLLFTADPYSKIVDPRDKDTALLFGDGAAVTLLGNAPRWQIGRFHFGSSGAEREAIRIDVAASRLAMNGRGVFAFTATVVPGSIREAARLNEIGLAELDAVVLHQGSRYIVDTIRERLELPESKVPFVAGDYGNTVSSSIPLALEALEARLPEARAVALSGFGVGLSWASTVLRRASSGSNRMKG
jgi:3-oxoacyl-[acyl-carrier-protein] synthase III